MKLIGIRTPKPRQYAYKPVFFDPEKEEQEKRKKELEDIGEYVPGSQLKERMRLKRTRIDDDLKKKSRRSSILITILLLAILLYIIFVR